MQFGEIADMCLIREKFEAIQKISSECRLIENIKVLPILQISKEYHKFFRV
jgi:hypothetical protein